MNDINSMRERVANLFSRALNVDVPSMDTDLFDTGVLDSLAFVELLLQLEREFGVTTSVEDLEIDNFKSITRIAEFVMKRAAISPDVPNQPVALKFGTT
jgi:methoxymalonate biosynthesis acyl carrier protein